MSIPKITVMMPAYNVQKYLSESIESIIRQDFPSWELVIFDDGSTDGTFRIAKEYQKRDSRIRVYRSSSNRGVAYTRNRILKLARGKYLAVHDADDIMLQGRLKKQVKLLDKRPKVGVVFGKAITLEKGQKSLGSALYPCFESRSLQRSQELRRFSLGIAHSSVMLRKAIVSKEKGYNERLHVGEDGDFLRRFWSKTQFYYMNMVCCLYRLRSDSLMGRESEHLKKMENIVND